MPIKIQHSDDAFIDQHNQFCSKVDTYSGTLGLDAAKITAVKADNAVFNYMLSYIDQFDTFKQGTVNYKNILRHGKTTDALGDIPKAPAQPPAAPTAVPAGMQKRFSDIIQDCVRSSNYTTSIGEDLGIEAPKTAFNPDDGKPVFKIVTGSGGHPNLIWKKGLFKGVSIYKNTGSGYTKIDKDLNPDYLDKSALPPAGTSAVWKYKLIYLFGINDDEVGSFSEEVAVTVFGSV